ncbi:uncharacterized protein LOC111377383, partial [Olea europaea var. sylvestris]|uniref:uncharacterized protein LOC111377383 n=1 Tax=Olea europaea var. sylvestris TaxID=158386 RepID=UPI000C1CF444
NCLQPKACDSINPQNQQMKQLIKKRDAIMVVVILIATMAFQAGVTPPGGVWQDNATDNSHKAGEAVMAHIHPKVYTSFVGANTIAFVSSLSTILLLLSGSPFRSRLFMWNLVVIMWLMVTSTAITYAISIVVVTTQKDKKPLIYIIGIGLIVWCSVMGVWFLGRSLQKQGITMWRPRRFRDLVGNTNLCEDKWSYKESLQSWRDEEEDPHIQSDKATCSEKLSDKGNQG